MKIEDAIDGLERIIKSLKEKDKKMMATRAIF